jgi:hypothetical protein
VAWLGPRMSRNSLLNSKAKPLIGGQVQFLLVIKVSRKALTSLKLAVMSVWDRNGCLLVSHNGGPRI